MNCLRLAAVLACLVLSAGCSGPQPAEERPEPFEPPPPPGAPSAQYELLAFDGESLVQMDENGGNLRELLQQVSPGGTVSSSPGGSAVAFSYRKADSTFLALLRNNRLEILHRFASRPAFSIAWAPDSERLAYGYRTADGGGVRISTPQGPVDPGCSASTAAAHWPAPERLVTGDGETRYVVSAEDCGTLASVDVRKMFQISYPRGRSTMAYIFRDLVYDRANRSYVPDSTLYVSNLDGTNQEELFDNAYQPRHPTWSPDGTTLALDIQLQEPLHRRRAVLSVPSGSISYMVPPSAFADADVVHPLWSPSGRHIAFELRRDGTISAAVQTFGRTSVLASDVASTFGWIDDETVAYVTRDDSLKAVSLSGDVRFALGPAMTLVWARRIPKAP